MRTAIVFEARREGYSIDQVERPMTVGELMSMLKEYDKNDIVIVSCALGYTYNYGTIRPDACTLFFEGKDGKLQDGDY